MLSSLLSTIAQADAYVSSENELFLLDRIAVDDGSDGIARFEWITGRHAVRAVSSIDSYIYSDSLAYIDSNFSYSFFNSLAGIFRIISMPLASIGKICSLIYCFCFLSKNKSKMHPFFLCYLALQVDFYVICWSCYNELRSCSSIAYMYLCGAYPLAQVFSVLAIIAVVQTLIAFKNINLTKME